MQNPIFVKVVGFRDVERHALNTVFRLSLERGLSYALWTPDAPIAPQLALIDVDSYEGAMEIASPGFNQKLKLICVGANAPATALRTFARPLNWPDVVAVMDQQFQSGSGFDPEATMAQGTLRASTSTKSALLVGTSREQLLYLRARLALAGWVHVDEASDGGHALALARRQHYGLVIVNLDDDAIDGWKLSVQLVALEPGIGSVVLTTLRATPHTAMQAEQAGCLCVLEIPFDPSLIAQMLQKI